MSRINILDQIRIIRDPDNPEITQGATMPLVLAFSNGVVAETSSIRGAVSLIVGREFFDAKDAEIEWHHRLEAARKQSMFALERGVVSEIYDPLKGVIPDNYAAEPDDPDYEAEADQNNPTKIYIHNDKVFLLSMIKIGAIVIYEREDSYQLKDHKIWSDIRNQVIVQNCSWCLHRIEKSDDGVLICPIYNMDITKEDGEGCSSFAFLYTNNRSSIVYPGGTYFDIELSFDLEQLLELFSTGLNNNEGVNK